MKRVMCRRWSVQNKHLPKDSCIMTLNDTRVCMCVSIVSMITDGDVHYTLVVTQKYQDSSSCYKVLSRWNFRRKGRNDMNPNQESYCMRHQFVADRKIENGYNWKAHEISQGTSWYGMELIWIWWHFFHNLFFGCSTASTTMRPWPQLRIVADPESKAMPEIWSDMTPPSSTYAPQCFFYIMLRLQFWCSL